MFRVILLHGENAHISLEYCVLPGATIVCLSRAKITLVWLGPYHLIYIILGTAKLHLKLCGIMYIHVYIYELCEVVHVACMCISDY